jgi:hypothetical protein
MLFVAGVSAVHPWPVVAVPALCDVQVCSVLDNVPPALAQDCEGLQMALTRFANQDLTATYVFIPINTNPDGAEGKAYVHGSLFLPIPPSH